MEPGRLWLALGDRTTHVDDSGGRTSLVFQLAGYLWGDSLRGLASSEGWLPQRLNK